MGIYSRIKEIRQHFCEGSNVKFAEMMGETPNTTSGWVSGKRGIGNGVIQKIVSKFPSVSLDWLLTGEGSMLKNEPQTTEAENTTELDEPYVDSTQLSRRFIEVVDYIKENLRDSNNTKQTYNIIAENIGIPVSLIDKVKEGKANVTYPQIKRLCSVYQVSRDWLEDGVGRPLPEGIEQEGIPMLSEIDAASLKPHFEASAAFCGMPAGFAAAIEEYKCRKYSIPNLTGHDFTLIASGRSMINRNVPEKSIFNNDVVACKIWKSRSYLRWGEVYALATQDGIIIKKVEPSELGLQYIKCVSFNVEEDFLPFDLPAEEIQDWAIVIGVAHVNKWS